MEPNQPYQLWLVLKRGLEPVREEEVVEDMLISHTPRKIKKSKKRDGKRQPNGPSRYKIVFVIFKSTENILFFTYKYQKHSVQKLSFNRNKYRTKFIQI